MGLIDVKNSMISLNDENMDIGIGVSSFYFETHENLYMKNKQSYFHRELDIYIS